MALPKVGCCGFPVGRKRYANRSRLVEVQQTFYEPPQTKTLQRWREELPPPFEFTVKAWQLITHEATSLTYRRLRTPIPERRKEYCGAFRPSEEVWSAWQRTAEAAKILGARLILFQCPASFTPTAEHRRNLRAFFRRLQRDQYMFVWEPRGQWTPEEIRALCEELDLVHAVDPFAARPVAGAVRYFRLHGKTGYRYRYTDDDLAALAQMCAGRKPTYVLFNNISMFEDAGRFLERVGWPANPKK